LSQLFPIEEQSVRNLVNVTSEPNGYKDFSYVGFHHHLFEVTIDFEEECSQPSLLVQCLETRSMFLQGAKQHHIKHLEDVNYVKGKDNDSCSLMSENRDNIIRRMT
jgi:hypothetical protein